MYLSHFAKPLNFRNALSQQLLETDALIAQHERLFEDDMRHLGVIDAIRDRAQTEIE